MDFDLTGYGNDGESQTIIYKESEIDSLYDTAYFDGSTESYIELENNGILDTKYSISIIITVVPELSQTEPIVTYDTNNIGVSLWQYEET